MVILSLLSALKPSGDKGETDDGEGDDESSSRFHEPQIVARGPPAAANQRGAIETSEDNSSDSGDDQSGSTDSASGSHSPPPPDDTSQARGTESVFLPTLSNGFIPGGSDTDWSDSEARAADGVRKNRRGQRARRA
jgi:hypothetical protein